MANITLLLFITTAAGENLRGLQSTSSPGGAKVGSKSSTLRWLTAAMILSTESTYLNINPFFNQAEKKFLKNLNVDLKTIVENDLKLFRDIVNATELKTDNKTINTLLNFKTLLEEIKSNHKRNPNNSSNNTTFEIDNNIRKEQRDNYTSEDGVTSPTFDAFVRLFLRKIDNAVQNKTIPNETRRRMASRRRNRRIYDLEVWDAGNSTDDFTNDTRRVYNGEQVSIKKYPFMSSLHVMGNFVCAGTIISKVAVITAASCMHLAFPNKQFIYNIVHLRVGSDFTAKDGVLIPIADIFFHPHYDAEYMEHNLAIAMIENRDKFKKHNKNVKRIEYGRGTEKLPQTSGVVMLGWGDKDSYSKYSGPISLGRLEVYAFDGCKDIYSEHYVNDNNFCAGFVSIGGGACTRDIGGPGIVGSKLVGVISFGPPVCGTPDAPTVFTQLGFYADWIDSILGNKTVVTGQTGSTHMVTVPTNPYAVTTTTPAQTEATTATGTPKYRNVQTAHHPRATASHKKHRKHTDTTTATVPTTMWVETVDPKILRESSEETLPSTLPIKTTTWVETIDPKRHLPESSQESVETTTPTQPVFKQTMLFYPEEVKKKKKKKSKRTHHKHSEKTTSTTEVETTVSRAPVPETTTVSSLPKSTQPIGYYRHTKKVKSPKRPEEVRLLTMLFKELLETGNIDLDEVLYGKDMVTGKPDDALRTGNSPLLQEIDRVKKLMQPLMAIKIPYDRNKVIALKLKYIRTPRTVLSKNETALGLENENNEELDEDYYDADVGDEDVKLAFPLPVDGTVKDEY